MELQEQTNVYNKDLRSVRSRLTSLQREARMNAVTTHQIESLDPKIPLYRTVGKAFVLTGRNDIEGRLEREISELTKNERDLTDRQEYLERRIASNNNNLRDLTSGM
jgi:prefoldin subunit 1